MEKHIFLSIKLILFLTVFTNAQEYKRMINSSNQFRLIEIQESANNYFLKNGKGKGSGYKQYKRWEYNALRLVDEKGYVKSNTSFLTELKKYNAKLNNNAKYTISKSDSWQQIGPTKLTVTYGHNPGIGRITSIAIDKSNTNHFIVGSETGGVWRTVDKGNTWMPLSDNASSMYVYSLAMHPTDSKIYYWGSFGTIFISKDSGSTWSELGATGGGMINRILVNPKNPQIIFVSDYYNGIYRSTNGGKNWVKVINDYGFDIEFKPNDYNTVYASGYDFYKSTDGGENWKTVNKSGFGIGFKLIEVSPANENTVYVLEENNALFGGLYLSSDSGNSFIKRDHKNKNYFGYASDASDNYGQAPRDMAMAVSPTDINEVHIGGIITFRSKDGGVTFNATSDWYVGGDLGYCHADIDDMVYHNNELFIVSDGGVYIAPNPTEKVTNNFFEDKSTGMGIHQFYKIGLSKSTPTVITGGSQDNGTSTFYDNIWKNWGGADGVESFIDKNNPNIIYGTEQEGVLLKSIDGGNTQVYINKPPGYGNWVTPFEQDPKEENTIYVGYDNVYKSIDGGEKWEAISQKFSDPIYILKIAPSNNKIMYASLADKMYKTTTGSGNWKEIYSFTGYINSITIHPKNPNKIAVATTDNGKVYISDDGGDTWKVKNTGLPNFFALTLAWQDNNKDGLYLGMNYGVYYIDNTLTSWQNFSNLLPNVYINEIEISEAEGKIYAGTYGRGVWASNLYNSTLSNEDLQLSKILKIYPNPANSDIIINSSITGKAEIRLFTLEGKLVYYKKVNSLQSKKMNLENLSSGMYFLRINMNNAVVTKKIIKS